MNSRKVLTLPCYDIVVTLLKNEDGTFNGAIQSSLKDGEGFEDNDYFDTAMDAIESLILAHACAGIDVTSPQYVEGIVTSVEAASNNLL